jgi:hypothetical protein
MLYIYVDTEPVNANLLPPFPYNSSPIVWHIDPDIDETFSDFSIFIIKS